MSSCLFQDIAIYYRQSYQWCIIINYKCFSHLFTNKLNMIDSSQVDRKIYKAIAHVSKSQIYQKKLFIFLGMIEIIVGFNSLINAMVFTNPLFQCYGTKVSQTQYCQNRDKCNYINNFTGTYHAGLYCQNRDLRMALQSTFALGCIFGLLIMPVMSNTKGRKKSINQCLIYMIIGDVLIFFGIYFKMYKMIAFGQIITAFGSVALSIIGYCVNYDYLSDDMRDVFAYYYTGSWLVTDVIVLFIYYMIPSWMFFTLGLCIVPGIAFLAYFHSFFLESPHYYIINRGDFERANDIIKQLAVINKSTQDQYFKAMKAMKELSTIMIATVKRKASAFETFKVIFSKSQYVKALFCLVFIRMAYFSFYYGAQSCLERTGFNFGISLFLAGFGQFTGYLTGSELFTRWSRKKVLAITNIATACIGILYFFKIVQESALISSIILYLSFMASSFNVAAINLVQAQSFCSSIRSTAIGYVLALAFFVRLGIPFATGYMNQIGVHPIVASSILIFVLGILPTLAVEETYGWACLDEPLNARMSNLDNRYSHAVELPHKIELQKFNTNR